MKKYQDKNVYEAAKERIKFVFENFEKVYVSFSGGKDSSVVLNLALDYMREHREKRKLGILFLDLEGQYSATINFIREILSENAEYLDVYWVCLPLNLRNSVSVFQPFWTCWDIDTENRWSLKNLFPNLGNGIQTAKKQRALWEYARTKV